MDIAITGKSNSGAFRSTEVAPEVFGWQVDSNPDLKRQTIKSPEVTNSMLQERMHSFAKSRGELLARNLLSKSGEDWQPHITRLDARFSQFLKSCQDHLRGDLSVLQELSTEARIIQDQSRFGKFQEYFYKLGENLGESQGREIDVERTARIQCRIERIERQLVHRARDLVSIDARMDLPMPREFLTKPEPDIIQALRAALELGESNGINNRQGAEIAAAKIYQAIGGWKEYLPFAFLKDFSGVQALIQGLSRAEIGFVDCAFRDRAGCGLNEALIHAYGKRNAARVYQLLGADEVGVAAFSIVRELAYPFQSRTARGMHIHQIYEKLSMAQIPLVEEQVLLIQKVADKSATEYLASYVSAREAQKLQALREGDVIREKALHLDDLLSQGPRSALKARAILRDLPAEDLPKLKKCYQSEFGHSLRISLENSVPHSPARDLCLAVVDQNREKIAAATLLCALEYREDWIGAPFVNQSQEKREFLIKSYNKIYRSEQTGDFWSDLKGAVWREDYYGLARFPFICRALEKLWWPCMNSYPFIESLIKRGNLAPAELLRYFMEGIGTDVDGIYSVLTNRTKEDIQEIEHDYALRYAPGPLIRFARHIPILNNFILTGELRHDLRVELSGDSDFDVALLCDGLPEGNDAKVLCSQVFDRLCRRYRHEHSGILLRRGTLSVFRGDRLVLERFEDDFRRASEYYHQVIESMENPSAGEVKRFRTLTQLAEIQANAYRHTKISLGVLFLNSGAFIGATIGATSVLALASFSYPLVASSAFAGSLVWRLINGQLILGKGFGKGDAIFQSLRAAVDGASMFSVRLGLATLGQFIGAEMSKGVAQSGFKSGLHRFIKSVEDRIRRQDKARHVINGSALLPSQEQLSQRIGVYSNRISEYARQGGEYELSRFPPIEEIFIRAMLP